MTVSLYPTTVSDDFLPNPEDYLKLAQSTPYFNRGCYPGVRSGHLHELSPDLFHLFCSRLFSQWHALQHGEHTWNVEVTFQRISPNKERPVLNLPWIHRDEGSIFGGLLYLGERESQSGGTSIYSLVDVSHSEKTAQQTSDKALRTRVFQDPDSLTDEEVSRANDRNNSGFELNLQIGAKYNRLLSFGGNQWHSQTSYDAPKEEFRLTMPFFVYSLNCTQDMPPMERVRRVSLR